MYGSLLLHIDGIGDQAGKWKTRENKDKEEGGGKKLTDLWNISFIPFSNVHARSLTEPPAHTVIADKNQFFTWFLN